MAVQVPSHEHVQPGHTASTSSMEGGNFFLKLQAIELEMPLWWPLLQPLEISLFLLIFDE
jgi:hypothetical protein